MSGKYHSDLYNSRSNSSTDFILLLVIIVAVTLWRLSVHFSTDFTLYLDEAYYWYWAKNLDWGFYSKPPAIAGIIAATTSICGDTELCVRSGSLIVYPFTTILVYLSAARLFDSRIGLYSGVVFLTIPGVSLSSLLISTDVALLFSWALALYAFIRTEEEGSDWRWWVLLGIAGGLGMLSKYTMGVFVFSAFLYLIVSGRILTFVRNPGSWLALIIAALIWSPNIVWNMQHDFITFQHTSDISQVGATTLHWDELAEFFFSQLGVFGLILFPLLIWASFSRTIKQHRLLLLSFSWVFLFIIFAQALFGRANANWAAPAYVSASIFVSAWLIQKSRARLLATAIAINLTFAFATYYYGQILDVADIELSSRNDPLKRVRGWREIGEQFEEIRAKYPNAILLGDSDRQMLTHLAYSSRPVEVRTWNPEGKIRNQFDVYNGLEKSEPGEFLYVSNKDPANSMHEAFERIEPLGKLYFSAYDNHKIDYKVYYVSD